MYYNTNRSEMMEIFADASLTSVNNRVFTCSGAICSNTEEEKYIITPDSTNNRGELLGIYLGIQMANRNLKAYPERFNRINLYSDSQFAIYGISRWMYSWIKKKDNQGILYGSTGAPVKNQEIFMMIVTYCVVNRLEIYFYNQKGHVNTNSQKELSIANEQFYRCNGFYLKPEDIYKISFYNNMVDNNSRILLRNLDANQYPKMRYGSNKELLCQYIVPENFGKYVRKGKLW